MPLNSSFISQVLNEDSTPVSLQNTLAGHQAALHTWVRASAGNLALGPQLRPRVVKSMRPHRRQPTRLPRPWDSPGKNTGVGCHSPNEKKEEPQRDGQEEQTSVCVLSAKLCWTRCDPMDCRPPGSSVHGILQARIREWVAISSFRGTSWPRDPTCVFCIGCCCC